MGKKIISISVIILSMANSASFSDAPMKQSPKPGSTESLPPLTQHPLTLPFNKFSNDIILNYEARRQSAADTEETQNENERYQASRDRFKKEKTYLLSGKF